MQASNEKTRMFLRGLMGAVVTVASLQAHAQTANHRIDPSQFCEKFALNIAKSIPSASEAYRLRAAGKETAFRVLNNVMIGNWQRFARVSDVLTVDEAGIYADRWLKIEDSFTMAMGAQKAAIVITDAEDLRLLPMTAQKRDIILLVNQANILSRERVDSISALAERKQIRLFTFWVGSKDSPDEISGRHWLEGLVLATGGRFVDFSGGPAVCR